LTWEFLSSLRIDKHKSGKVAWLHFRLMNQGHSLTLPCLRPFWFRPSLPIRAPKGIFDRSALWAKLTGVPDVPGMKRLANTIHNAPIRIWHKYMGWTVFAAPESHSVRAEEMEILGAYLTRGSDKPFKICIAHHFALHLQKIANSPGQSTPICVGGVITFLMKRLQRNVNLTSLNSLTGQFLTSDYLLHPLVWLKRDPLDGVVYWVVKIDGKDTLSVPMPNAQK